MYKRQEELIAARRAEPWREALRKSKKNKERTDIPRVEMNELDAENRSHTRLEEVNLGLTKEQVCLLYTSGANGIITSVGMLLVMRIIGIAQGMQPIVGFNFGAKKYERVQETLRLVISLRQR